MRTMWSAADFVYPDSPSGPPLLRLGRHLEGVYRLQIEQAKSQK